MEQPLGRRSAAHADAAICATTALADTADFPADALAADPRTLMIARVEYVGRSVLR